MALIKNIQLNTGVTATYHRIGMIDINWKTKDCLFVVEMFLDENAKNAGHNFLESKNYGYSMDKFTFDVNQPLVSQLYVKLKLENEWSDATDN